MKKITRVLMVPAQERVLNEIQNNPLYTVTGKQVVTFPKEGIINIIIDYEDYSEDNNNISAEDYDESEELV